MAVVIRRRNGKQTRLEFGKVVPEDPTKKPVTMATALGAVCPPKPPTAPARYTSGCVNTTGKGKRGHRRIRRVRNGK